MTYTVRFAVSLVYWAARDRSRYGRSFPGGKVGQVILIFTPTLSLLYYISLSLFYRYRRRFLLLFASADLILTAMVCIAFPDYDTVLATPKDQVFRGGTYQSLSDLSEPLQAPSCRRYRRLIRSGPSTLLYYYYSTK